MEKNQYEKISRIPLAEQGKTEQEILAEKTQGLTYEQREKIKRQDDYKFQKDIKGRLQSFVLIPFFALFTVTISLLIGVVVWHMIASSSYTWLEERQVHKIEILLKSGAIGALISQFVRKMIG